MKFEHHLYEENVPEWRKAYINYKQGKSYLKAIRHAVEKLETVQQQAEKPVDDHDQAEDDETRALTLSMGYARASENTLAQYTTTDSESEEPIIQGRDQSKTYDAISASTKTKRPYSTALTIDEDRSERGSLLRDHLDGSDVDGLPKFTRPQRRPSSAVQVGEAALAQGAHIIRNLTRRFTMGSFKSVHGRRTRVIRMQGNSLDSVMETLLDEEKVFFKFLDSQLEMVDNFYREKETEAVMKLKILKQQLYVADEWKRRYDERIAQAEATGGWYSAEWSRVRNELGSLVVGAPDITSVTLGALPEPLSDAEQTISPSGFKPSAKAGREAIIDMSAESGLRPRQSRKPEEEIQQGSPLTGPMEESNQMLLDNEKDQRMMFLHHKVARSRIKVALYEFYRGLEMTKNYKILNETGFTKIMKKFDKTAGWKASQAFKASKLQLRYFMCSSTLDELIKETETLYVDKFEDGNRHRGMSKLRIPDQKNKSHHASVARASFFLGLALILLVMGMQDVFKEETQTEVPYWDSLLRVYAGLFLTTLFACLFGVNMYVWAKSRINYKFIFEFDPRDNLDYHEFFELPIFFMFLLCLGVYLDFGSHLTDQIATAYYPLVIFIIIVLVILCPLPIASWSARKWFIQSFSRVLVSGCFGVEFRDFFLADELNSLSYSIEQFEFAICAYANQWNDLAHTCVTSQMWITPFLTALPPWFRLIQCLRRYRDTLEWYPHLLNAGKYSSSLVSLFVYFSYRYYGGAYLKLAFIAMSTIASSFTFSWDVYMDWGLFRFGKHGGGAYGHPFLRAELVYSKATFYYLAIVFDFVGRFAWVVRLIPMNVDGMIVSFSLALVEVLRRWVWNFFRLENEHLNNCGQFRAIKDIPLPFHIHFEGDSDEESSEEDQNDDEQAEVATLQELDDMEVIAEDSEGGSPNQTILATTDTSSEGLALSRGGSRRSTVPQRTQSQPKRTRFGTERSTTFVDSAMAEAGFDEKRAQLKAASKFYDRRDFENRTIDSVQDLIMTSSRLPTIGGGSRPKSMVTAREQRSDETDKEGDNSNDPGPSTRTRRALSKRVFKKERPDG